MKFPFPRVSPLHLSCVSLLGLAATAWACGPDFPNSYLTTPDSDLLAAPPGNFKAEIARLSSLATPNLPWKVVQAKTSENQYSDTALQATRRLVLQADTDDLRAALQARGDSPDQVEKTTKAFADSRQMLEEWSRKRVTAKQGYDEARRFGGNATTDAPNLESAPVLTLPVGLPEEFVRYFRGVQAWDEDRKADARQIWTDLLALPAAQRNYRSTWAAYMLARAWAEEAEHLTHGYPQPGVEAAAKAVEFARQTRVLAGAEFVDSQGLAAASFGWEAKAELLRANYDLAIGLYLNQYALGDVTALESLRSAASLAARNASPAQLADLAKSPAARSVLTAYLVAGGSVFAENFGDSALSTTAANWAVALEKAGVTDQPQADRLAWVAYEGGQFGLAKSFANVAAEKSPVAEWIRAQLALRSGNLAEGEKHLRGALAGDGLSAAQKALANGELSRTCLAEDHPADALLASIEGGHDEDASYIAERVLKLDELRSFVDGHCPAIQPAPAVNGDFHWNEQPDEVRASIRALLARRLARSELPDLAEEYFTGELRVKFHAYVRDVRTGFDVARPVAERAAAFWRAAQTAHQDGMNLLGTALEPDWSIWLGEYTMEPVGVERQALAHAAAGSLLAPPPAELAQLAATPVPAQRFHYRYRAADLAWWAASLMPNDSDETAKIIDDAGCWLKDRDPVAANKFFQALVIRCGNTALGQTAAKAHWFPVVKPAGSTGAG